MWSSQRNNSYHSSISVNSSFNLKGETCPSLFMEKEVLQKKVLWYVFISLCNFAYNPRLTEFLRKWNQTTIACISEIPNPSVFTPSFHPFPPIFLPLPHSDFFSTHFSIPLRHPYFFLIHSSISLPHPYFFSIHPPLPLANPFFFPPSLPNFVSTHFPPSPSLTHISILLSLLTESLTWWHGSRTYCLRRVMWPGPEKEELVKPTRPIICGGAILSRL